MSQISVDSVIPQSGTTVTIGGPGDTVTLGSGASQSGFGSAAYAANASASTGAVNVDASDNLQFDSGFGSTATAYGCRAWVNFNGTGTVSINGSGNVSSITDVSTGQYEVNFSTSMPDVNYASSYIHGYLNAGDDWALSVERQHTVSKSKLTFVNYTVTAYRDVQYVYAQYFR